MTSNKLTSVILFRLDLVGPVANESSPYQSRLDRHPNPVLLTLMGAKIGEEDAHLSLRKYQLVASYIKAETMCPG